MIIEGALLLLAGAFVASIFWGIRYMGARDELRLVQSHAIMEDLELATTDQLLKEFRGRPENVYVILTPIDNKEEQGLKIEINNISAHDGLVILKLASTIIHREMESRGMKVPDIDSELLVEQEEDEGDNPEDRKE
jgi:hypothetical protein